MRVKKKILYLHKSTPLEKLHCLTDIPQWAVLLLGRGKKYNEFLQKLSDKNFYKDLDGRKTFKQIATDLDFKITDVSKWTNQIYDDIYDLNETDRELFKTTGIRHDLYFKHFDDRAVFTLWLPQTPKRYEKFEFRFVKAIVGTSNFWVKDICHQFEDGQYKVFVTLEGRGLNEYRELLVDRAFFDGVLGFYDLNNDDNHEIDKVLKRSYKI